MLQPTPSPVTTSRKKIRRMTASRPAIEMMAMPLLAIGKCPSNDLSIDLLGSNISKKYIFEC